MPATNTLGGKLTVVVNVTNRLTTGVQFRSDALALVVVASSVGQNHTR